MIANIALIIALFITSTLAQGTLLNSTIDPTTVDYTTRSQWCTSELSVCNQLCSNNPNANTCNDTTLSFSCLCSNNSSPGLQYYTELWGYCLDEKCNNKLKFESYFFEYGSGEDRLDDYKVERSYNGRKSRDWSWSCLWRDPGHCWYSILRISLKEKQENRGKHKRCTRRRRTWDGHSAGELSAGAPLTTEEKEELDRRRRAAELDGTMLGELGGGEREELNARRMNGRDLFEMG
ncbi:hypothetical protein D0Z07_6567 [Hyphodiscus hymeniophilus]|uniref:DUF7707 domain-containing protein n=1 Tax=Hyphodiscus hymeniophilus TaxID=353542 RepID=A0A9P6VGV6_9HELO|nr:hypothetical protein D0Z07_6567 [Hyphodiscus hymeniophilus]